MNRIELHYLAWPMGSCGAVSKKADQFLYFWTTHLKGLSHQSQMVRIGDKCLIAGGPAIGLTCNSVWWGTIQQIIGTGDRKGAEFSKKGKFRLIETCFYSLKVWIHLKWHNLPVLVKNFLPFYVHSSIADLCISMVDNKQILCSLNSCLFVSWSQGLFHRAIIWNKFVGPIIGP